MGIPEIQRTIAGNRFLLEDEALKGAVLDAFQARAGKILSRSIQEKLGVDIGVEIFSPQNSPLCRLTPREGSDQSVPRSVARELSLNPFLATDQNGAQYVRPIPLKALFMALDDAGLDKKLSRTLEIYERAQRDFERNLTP